MEWLKDGFTISCDPGKLDQAVVAQFLASSYWAKGIPASTVEKSLDNSLCFSLLEGNRQIGFARVISDRATFAYLADVFVLAEYRGKGLAKWMIECILNHSELQGLRRWLLATRDAHELYRKYGFTPLKVPDMFMERLIPNIYQR